MLRSKWLFIGFALSYLACSAPPAEGQKSGEKLVKLKLPIDDSAEISPDGKHLSFSCRGDFYLVPIPDPGP